MKMRTYFIYEEQKKTAGNQFCCKRGRRIKCGFSQCVRSCRSVCMSPVRRNLCTPLGDIYTRIARCRRTCAKQIYIVVSSPRRVVRAPSSSKKTTIYEANEYENKESDQARAKLSSRKTKLCNKINRAAKVFELKTSLHCIAIYAMHVLCALQSTTVPTYLPTYTLHCRRTSLNRARLHRNACEIKLDSESGEHEAKVEL